MADHDREVLLPQPRPCCNAQRACLAFVGVLVAVVVVIASLAAYTNTDADNCGAVSLPSTFLLDKRDYSLRNNVDLFDLSDGAKGSKVGELYRKLLTRSKVFRLKNTNNEVVGTMTPSGASRFSVALCGSDEEVFRIQRHEFSSGLCGAANHTWDIRFDVSRKRNGSQEMDLVLTSHVQALHSRSVIAFSKPGSSNIAAELDPQGSGDNWVANVYDTSAVPSWMLAFFSLAVDESSDPDCSHPTSSPSLSPSPSPSPSPSASSAVSSAVALLLPLLVRACTWRW